MKLKQRFKQVFMYICGLFYRRKVLSTSSFQLLVCPSAQISIHGKFQVEGKVAFFERNRVHVESNAFLRIGDKVYFNHDTSIHCANSIEIGNNSIVAWDVQIFDTDFHSIDGKPKAGSIKIGDSVWIGSRATILKDTSIGSGSVVAAGAVCKGAYPENCLIAGVPGRVIRRNIKWMR